MRNRKQKPNLRGRILTSLAVIVPVVTLGIIGLSSFIYESKGQGLNQPPVESGLADQTAAKNEPRVEFTVSVICAGHVECDKGLRPLKLAIKYLESRVNASFKIQRVFIHAKQPTGSLEDRWEEWFRIAQRIGATENHLTVILVEDYPDNVDTFDFRMEGIIGLASGLGVVGGPGPAALLAKVMGGEQFMTRLLIHEIGHTLGAEHIEEGIMHPCACANQYSDEFSLHSIAQINQHLAKVRLYRMLTSGPQGQKQQPKNMSVPKAAKIVEKGGEVCEE